MIIPALLRHHKGQLRHDLARVGVNLDDIIREKTCWNTAWDHIREILHDPSSHTVAAVHGHRYVPSPAEIAAWDIHEREMNAQRGKNAQYKRFPRPWAGKPPTYEVPSELEMTPDREARRARLSAMF
ncbi:hypothetical protein F6W69_10680 [Microbacterium oxydans]|uniref:hypothetical protein n=1 Tax=Microbacterium oxydans TaxID=82380 RepID=UPI001143BB22|nr:hypothetical protein [Microbacterium oxydans]KAB1891053.1 hypothetical protein F6W69_10680 [Microbacterium oxydans]GED39085.1 hypothetical protein MOX01_22270 [Microbacterium oxydans]